MRYDPTRPLAVQNDGTVLLESRHAEFEKVREELAEFAELVKSPEYVHTYRISALSLWNAAVANKDTEEIISFLQQYGKYDLPHPVRMQIMSVMGRCGKLVLIAEGDRLFLKVEDEETFRMISAMSFLRNISIGTPDGGRFEIRPLYRGRLKQELLRAGFPVLDLAGYHQGESLPIRLRTFTAGGRPFSLREYQRRAADAFYQEGNAAGGSGVVVLPCGAGKTVVGIAVMARLNCATLILTSSATSVKQWKREILDKTELTEEQVGEYNGLRKEVLPVTIATYQILTHRRSKEEEFTHMALFNERDWGLIIYDEVHLLPAPVFRVTADIQATRRLGLTATLVREDGREEDVFSLIGPKRFDMPWRRLEAQGWIAGVNCSELRVPLAEDWLNRYWSSPPRERFRVAGENPAKLKVLSRLLEKHSGEPTLIIGQYLSQLRRISDLTGAPMISGETPFDERERLYERFKQGMERLLVVSRVANFAVDLPDAGVAIQVSGSFGSRQEEAQRLGRVLRPKNGRNEAFFYTLVSIGTKEEEFSEKRQLFLVEQGYRYRQETIDLS